MGIQGHGASRAQTGRYMNMNWGRWLVVGQAKNRRCHNIPIQTQISHPFTINRTASAFSVPFLSSKSDMVINLGLFLYSLVV